MYKRQVFGAYGISVDARHLTLIADFMTSGGGYRGCSRHGIATCTSPLLKMSFETSATFLKDAAMKGTVDSLGSAASKIVLGQPVGLGTGAVAVHSVLTPATASSQAQAGALLAAAEGLEGHLPLQ